MAKEGGTLPPCAECVPELLEENRDACDIYFRVQGQVILGGMDGTVIDINHMAIHSAMDLYNVEDKVSCFEKVCYIFNYFREDREHDSNPEVIQNQYKNPLAK